MRHVHSPSHACGGNELSACRQASPDYSTTPRSLQPCSVPMQIFGTTSEDGQVPPEEMAEHHQRRWPSSARPTAIPPTGRHLPKKLKSPPYEMCKVSLCLIASTRVPVQKVPGYLAAGIGETRPQVIVITVFVFNGIRRFRLSPCG